MERVCRYTGGHAVVVCEFVKVALQKDAVCVEGLRHDVRHVTLGQQLCHVIALWWEVVGSGGKWWEVVGSGGRWWEVVEGGGKWWEEVESGGKWWEVVGSGGRRWEMVSACVLSTAF